MKTTLFVLFTLVVLMSTPLWAAEPVPVDLEADQLEFDRTSGRYHARGQVRLTQGALRMTCDELWWNQQTGEIEALGEVSLRRPGEVLSGQRIDYNLQQGTGVVEEGEAFWAEKSLHLTGKRLERLGPNRFRIQDGKFTVCDPQRPAWSVGTTSADLTIERYLVARNALIYIKDIPAFYLPYLMVPVKARRASGFLLPSIGFSDRRGTEFSTAWYQVIAPNQDATFRLDYLSRLGTGTGMEYRYLFPHLRGELQVYNVAMREGDDRHSLAWQQVSQFNENLRAVIDAELVDSRDYYDDFAEETGEYNRQTAISTLFVNQRLTRSNLTLSAKYIKDLEQTTAPPWQTAPQLDYALSPQRLGRTSFFYSLDTRYQRFDEDSAADAQRLMLRPELAFYRNFFGLEVDATYGYRQRQYLEVEEGLQDSYGSDDFVARLSGRLSRTFNGRDSEWLHSMEPEINYRYADETSDVNLPDFDRFDRSVAVNEVGYALVNRLIGKWRDDEGSAVRREVVWLRLSQAYRLHDEATRSADFNPLLAELILRPSQLSQFDVDLLYDFDAANLTNMTVSGQLDDGGGNSMHLTFQRRESAVGTVMVENANLGLETAWLKPVYLGYQQRYDFLDDRQLEQVVNVDLRQQCWGLKLTYREREDEQSIIMTLSLGGIGEIGSIGTSLASD